MSLGKTITTFVITALLGAFTFIFAAPQKVFKARTDIKTKKEGEDRENLFI